MSADVTKELLIKIGTEGGEDAGNMFVNMDLSFNRMMGSIVGINSAWDLFNKVIGVAKRAMSEVWEQAQNFVDTGAKFEQLGIRFETIFGGSGPAQAALDWAVKFAATTPLTLEDVTAKMLKLKAYGFDPMNGMLETIGNAAYAVGADFDGIIVALGQMGLKGKVVQQELNQLSERNIPAIKWLKEELGLTGDQMKNIGELAISSDTAIKIILDRMSKEYAGGLKRAGDSWLGALSTVQDTYVIFQKKLMDSGPFEFLVRNIRDVRDAFSDWSEYTGSNIAFRAGGVITGHLESWKGYLLDDIIPAAKILIQSGYDMGKSLVPAWNILVDLSGYLAGAFLVSFKGASAAIDTVLNPSGAKSPGIMTLFDAVLDGFSMMMKWIVDIKTFAIKAVGEVKAAVGGIFISISTSEAGAELLSRFGLESIIPTLGQSLFREGTKMGYDAEASAKKSKDAIDALRKTFDLFDQLKVSPTDPFGLSKLKPGVDEDRAKLLWVRDVNEKTSGGMLYESDISKAANAGGRLLAGALRVQLGPVPGDPLLNIIVDYINRAIQAEGTIGAGF